MNIAFREGFSKLAAKLDLANAPSFVPCSGRRETWDVAWQSFLDRERDELILLLVDSEEQTTHEPRDAWQHLRGRDGWTALGETHGRYVFMMVTAMETWIAVDENALAARFKSDYRGNSVPKWPKPEAIDKNDVRDALEKASSGKFAKGEISFELIGLLDPDTVAARCPHAKHFFECLKLFCGTTQ